ncbi:MAG: metallophosphoesterase [Mangrovicoccus sp.]
MKTRKIKQVLAPLKSIWSGKDNPDPPEPARPMIAIGDIHGRLDLLDRLLDQIADFTAAENLTDFDLVCLGDMIDRGPSSAGVIERLSALETQTAFQFICLKGNHEAMALDACAAGGSLLRHWMRCGGEAMLNSFCLSPEDVDKSPYLYPFSEQTPENLRLLYQALDWIAERPSHWKSGSLVAVHAGLNPARPWDQQNEHEFLWGHKNFRRSAWIDPYWVVYGHIVTQSPAIKNRTIGIDTGAYASDILTSAVIIPQEDPIFLST